MQEKKRATFLINSLAGGGAEGVCVNVANGLAEQGWDINLVVLHLNNEAYKDRVSSKVKLDVLGVNHMRHSFFTLKKYINKNRPGKIIIFNYELTVPIILLRILFRFKYKIIARNINTISAARMQAKKERLWQRYISSNLVSFFYSNVDHVINQCNAMEKDLLKIYPKLTGKTSVIYNPIAQHIEEYSSSNNLRYVEKEDYFLCVGRLEEQKAFHYAIEAFSIILKTYPNYRLKIVGQGSLEISLKQLSINLGIDDRVDFEGFQKNTIPYYLHARATLLTSLFEGFPNVLIESIALGTPVIAFDCPSGPSEIIKQGVNGYLVEKNNQEDFVAKVHQVLTDGFENSELLKTVNFTQSCQVVKQWEELLTSEVASF